MIRKFSLESQSFKTNQLCFQRLHINQKFAKIFPLIVLTCLLESNFQAEGLEIYHEDR